MFVTGMGCGPLYISGQFLVIAMGITAILLFLIDADNILTLSVDRCARCYNRIVGCDETGIGAVGRGGEGSGSIRCEVNRAVCGAVGGIIWVENMQRAFVVCTPPCILKERGHPKASTVQKRGQFLPCPY